MGLLKTIIVVVLLLVVVGMVHKTLFKPPPMPPFDPNQYWGPGDEPADADTSIRDFKIEVSQEVLDDLQWRLNRSRAFVPPLEGIAQQYGFNTNLLKEIVEFWKTEYNWTERQAYLNQYPQYITNVQGLDIHFIHVKPENPGKKKVYPMLILHGWPSSVREFYDLIPILTTPSSSRDYVFEVIVPHVPGFGFSQGASKKGMGLNQVAVIMNNLMKRLGFTQFFCQGADIGAGVLQALTAIYPESVLGYHTSTPLVFTPLALLKYLVGSVFPSLVIKPEHASRVYPLAEKLPFALQETGFLHMQATKPDTIGAGLNESPEGLLGYILEKYISLTNVSWEEREDGGLLIDYTYPELLDNIMLYWITRSATTSSRIYKETFNKESLGQNVLRQPLQVPTAIARFRNDFYVPDGMLGEIFPKKVQVSDLEGGHFPALQVPKVLAADIFSAVDKFIKFRIMHPPFAEGLGVYTSPLYYRLWYKDVDQTLFN